MLDRLNKDEFFMSIAIMAADRATCLRKKVGTVLVKGGQIISVGYNGSPRNMKHCTEIGCLIQKDTSGNEHCIRTIHAEINAIIQSGVNGSKPDESTLYTSLFPCYDCAKAIISSGVKEVFFLSEYPESKSLELFNEVGIKCTKLNMR